MTPSTLGIYAIELTVQHVTVPYSVVIDFLFPVPIDRQHIVLLLHNLLCEYAHDMHKNSIAKMFV